MFAIVRCLSFRIRRMKKNTHSTQNECHSVHTYKRWIYFLLRFYAIIFLFERFFLPPLLFFAYGSVRKSFLVYHTLRVQLRFAFSQTIKFFLFLSPFLRCVLLVLTFYFYAKSLCSSSSRMVESCDKGERKNKNNKNDMQNDEAVLKM